MAFNRNILLCNLVFLISGLCTVVLCENNSDYQTNAARGFARNCDSGYSIACFKVDVVSFLEKMSSNREFKVLPGLSVVNEPDANQQKTEEIVAG